MPHRSARSLRWATLPLLFDLIDNLAEVVARGVLQRRKRHVGLQLLQPQGLANRQDVPVVDVSRTRGREGTGGAEHSFCIITNRDLEGITLDVGNLGPGVRGS